MSFGSGLRRDAQLRCIELHRSQGIRILDVGGCILEQGMSGAGTRGNPKPRIVEQIGRFQRELGPSLGDRGLARLREQAQKGLDLFHGQGLPLLEHFPETGSFGELGNNPLKLPLRSSTRWRGKAGPRADAT